MDVVYEIIKARYKKPTGHWVVITSAISNVPIFAYTYDWSQNHISYFLSATGNNNPSHHLYRTGSVRISRTIFKSSLKLTFAVGNLVI